MDGICCEAVVPILEGYFFISFSFYFYFFVWEKRLEKERGKMSG
jgi:hypothetical protein